MTPSNQQATPVTREALVSTMERVLNEMANAEEIKWLIRETIYSALSERAGRLSFSQKAGLITQINLYLKPHIELLAPVGVYQEPRAGKNSDDGYPLTCRLNFEEANPFSSIHFSARGWHNENGDAFFNIASRVAFQLTFVIPQERDLKFELRIRLNPFLQDLEAVTLSYSDGLNMRSGRFTAENYDAVNYRAGIEAVDFVKPQESWLQEWVGRGQSALTQVLQSKWLLNNRIATLQGWMRMSDQDFSNHPGFINEWKMLRSELIEKLSMGRGVYSELSGRPYVLRLQPSVKECQDHGLKDLEMVYTVCDGPRGPQLASDRHSNFYLLMDRIEDDHLKCFSMTMDLDKSWEECDATLFFGSIDSRALGSRLFRVESKDGVYYTKRGPHITHSKGSDE